MNYFKFSIYFLLFIIFSGFSQELPPIIKYETDTYKAGNQNWMISQDGNKYMYVANHSGLLEFNGSQWKLYESPNETTLRSVMVVNGKVYTGCYMDFGYWQRQAGGELTYTSLGNKIKDKILDDEQFWNIISYDNWVIFQSLDQLFVYDTHKETFNIIHPKGGVIKVYNIGASVYYQTINKGLFEVVNGKSVLITDEAVVKRTKVVSMYKAGEGIVLHTQLEGLFLLQNGALTPIPINMAPNNIYSSLQLLDGSYALGTVSNGVYIVSPQGKVLLHINQENGLTNNTVLSLFEDVSHNLWVGLDNGINCINLTSEVVSYVDDSGTLGTIYASALYNGVLYLGTNQGLFYKPFNQNVPFKFIDNTKGQVWALFEFQNTLFCGHDTGTFRIEGGEAFKIFSESGTWEFSTVDGRADILLQGNYYGISVLQKSGTNWYFRNRIDGFNYSSRYLEILGNTLYVSHEYKGIFQIETDNALNKVLEYRMLKNPGKGKNASIVKYQNSVWYASKDGAFKLNGAKGSFVKDSTISAIINKDGYTSGKLIVDKTDKLWIFTRNHINYFTHSNFNDKLLHYSVPIPYNIANTMSGYENISYMDDNKYLIGTVNGYYLFNPEERPSDSYKVYITAAENYRQNDSIVFSDLNKESVFNYTHNNFVFSFTIPQYSKYANAEYQYKLEGFNDQWSDYSLESSVSFKNLPPGNYTFRIRGKVGDNVTGNTETFRFTIQKPWFATNLALIVYLILVIVAAYVINLLYKNYYNKQKQKIIEENQRKMEINQLEARQQLMKTKTEMLEKDIESKNRELAASTLNLIKKNEVLATIKSDLKKLDSTQNLKTVINTINSNINEEDTWNLFSEAFNNADKDFLKKVKDAHPSLTPNDLRLCAYLRLNLSSKEIAPLLNISIRSVEIKRYRLRKKMDLEHEDGLVEYILSI